MDDKQKYELYIKVLEKIIYQLYTSEELSTGNFCNLMRIVDKFEKLDGEIIMDEEKEDVCFGGLGGYGITYCEMMRLQKENQKLKKEKGELKSALYEVFDYDVGVVSSDYIEAITDVIQKIKELEENNNE